MTIELKLFEGDNAVAGHEMTVSVASDETEELASLTNLIVGSLFGNPRAAGRDEEVIS